MLIGENHSGSRRNDAELPSSFLARVHDLDFHAAYPVVCRVS